jgi:cap1 methyltransferase
MAHKAKLKRKSYADFGHTLDNNNDTDLGSAKGSDFAKRLMTKMGYKEGQGLGKDSQGEVEVIPQSKQKGRRGLGYALSDIHIDSQFEWNSEKEKQFVSVFETVEWINECDLDLPSSQQLDNWWKEGLKCLSIDDEHNFCDPNILSAIINCKNVFDSLSGEELRRARSTSNPFETIEKGIFQNRAAMKMANIDAVFDMMFTEPTDESGKSLVKHQELLYFADICAGPGGFSEYVLWRKGWNAKGFGFTLKGPNDFKLEEFFAGSPETFEPHYGDGGLNGDGDIYKPQNLMKFRDFVIHNTDGLGAHFVMADGGFSVEGQENIQEILSKRIYLCQFLCALAILRPNGSFVCKLFDVFTPFSVGLIYLMYRVFKKVSIHKPNTSRPANSERYIICKWKKCGTTPLENYLFKLNCHLDFLTNNKSNQDIIEVVPLKILKEDNNFFEYITRSNNKIGERQILFLSKVKAFAENSQLDLKQPELRKECLNYWKVDVKSRVAPSRVDPMSKFQDLMSKSRESNDYFAYKPKLLAHENLKELEYINGFKCVVLGSENDYLKEAANPLSNVRGFFLGLGRQSIYYWDGSSSSKWCKFEAKLELPPLTLLYAEYVQELKGEGKAQRRIAAFHIIDPLFIGGTDVRDKCFEERNALAIKLAKAVTKTTQTEYAAVRMKRIYDLINIQQIFDNMDMRECKSGAQKVKLCYNINNSDRFINNTDRFIIPFGLLIINTVKQPWIVKWSRSQNKLYYFNLKTGKSLFDFPKESLADFRYTFSSRMLWKWDSDVNLMTEPNDNDDNKLLHRQHIEKFIQNLTQK